jgi:hypothetical protein
LEREDECNALSKEVVLLKIELEREREKERVRERERQREKEGETERQSSGGVERGTHSAALKQLQQTVEALEGGGFYEFCFY